MKKYKLEISIAAIFAALIIAFLWEMLTGLHSAVPYVLIGIALATLVAVMVPWPDKTGVKSGPIERYAPKFFAQAILSSVVGIALIVGVAALLNRERFSKSIDLTERKVHSLSDETIKFLSSLDKNVEIYCVPSRDPRENYCLENSHLRDLYAQHSAKIVAGDLNPADIGGWSKVRPAGYSRLVLMTEDGSRREVVGQVTESKLTNALINLIKTKKVVYFLTGSGEPAVEGAGDRTYATLVETLKDRAYEVKEHNISSGGLPADAQLVVAGSNTIAYSPIVENEIRRFLGKGGRLVLTINPYREPGMPKLFEDLGIRLDDVLLVNNRGATPFGAQLAQVEPMRPPIAVGEFSRHSSITGELPPGAFAIVDGARPITVTKKEGDDKDAALKLKHTELMSAMHAAPASIGNEAREKLPLEGPLANVSPDAGFDPKKTYLVGLQIEIEGASKLAEGIPASTVALANTSQGAPSGTAAEGENASKEPVATEVAKTDEKKEGENATGEKKDSAEVVVLGFDLIGPYERVRGVANPVILPLAVSHLHRDADLVSIPTKDFAPRSFKLDRNPGAYLFLFSGLLPVATALTGFYIWMRRRSA